MKEKLINFNHVGYKSLLLILLVSGLSFVRSIAWSTSNVTNLKHASDIYIIMSDIVDIKTIGLVLMLSSLALFATEFLNGLTKLYVLLISSFVCGVIHLVFGMIGVESANIFTTYYTNLLVGVVDMMLFAMGGIELWKTKSSQTTD